MSSELNGDWRNLPPIPEPEHDAVVALLTEGDDARGRPPFTPSQTFMNKRDRCHRSAFLYLKHRGGAGGHALNRGAIFHTTAERLRLKAIAEGFAEIPNDVGQVELNAVFSEHPELTVPAVERDYLRMLIYHYCVGEIIPPPQIVGVEQMLSLQVGRWTVRGKVDLITGAGPGLLDVIDYKTTPNMPSAEEWHHGGMDARGNPRFGGNFQTQLYAVLAAFGTTPEGLRVGQDVERWRLFLRFPAILFEEGLGYKVAEVSRLQLTNFLSDLESQLEALDHSLATRRWQPTPGSHCGECPAEYECPLPKHLRADSQAAAIDSIEDAERLGASWQFQQRRATQLKGRIRKAAEQNGWQRIYTGTDTALVFIPEHREALKKGGLARIREGIEGAVDYGHPFELADHVTSTQSTKFDKRKVEPKPQRKDEDADDARE